MSAMALREQTIPGTLTNVCQCTEQLGGRLKVHADGGNGTLALAGSPLGVDYNRLAEAAS